MCVSCVCWFAVVLYIMYVWHIVNVLLSINSDLCCVFVVSCCVMCVLCIVACVVFVVL